MSPLFSPLFLVAALSGLFCPPPPRVLAWLSWTDSATSELASSTGSLGVVPAYHYPSNLVRSRGTAWCSRKAVPRRQNSDRIRTGPTTDPIWRSRPREPGCNRASGRPPMGSDRRRRGGGHGRRGRGDPAHQRLGRREGLVGLVPVAERAAPAGKHQGDPG